MCPKGPVGPHTSPSTSHLLWQKPGTKQGLTLGSTGHQRQEEFFLKPW